MEDTYTVAEVAQLRISSPKGHEFKSKKAPLVVNTLFDGCTHPKQIGFFKSDSFFLADQNETDYCCHHRADQSRPIMEALLLNCLFSIL